MSDRNKPPRMSAFDLAVAIAAGLGLFGFIADNRDHLINTIQGEGEFGRVGLAAAAVIVGRAVIGVFGR